MLFDTAAGLPLHLKSHYEYLLRGQLDTVVCHQHSQCPVCCQRPSFEWTCVGGRGEEEEVRGGGQM